MSEKIESIDLSKNIEYLQEYLLRCSEEDSIVGYFISNYKKDLISWERALLYITISLLVQQKLILSKMCTECRENIIEDIKEKYKVG